MTSALKRPTLVPATSLRGRHRLESVGLPELPRLDALQDQAQGLGDVRADSMLIITRSDDEEGLVA